MTFRKKIGTISTGYLNNSLSAWSLTPCNNTKVYGIGETGYSMGNFDLSLESGVRPSINLKSALKIIDGDGTVDNPYRLQGDNDNPTGALLSTRYSGEYISFGIGENSLYRIVSHENGTGTKIVSNIPLKEDNIYKNMKFEDNVIYSKNNTIGTFLNGDYLTNGTYLTNDQVNMIEDDTTWYLGTISDKVNYKLSKYQDTTGSSLTTNTTMAKIGMLRAGELLASVHNYSTYSSSSEWNGQFLLTPYDDTNINSILNGALSREYSTDSRSFSPSMNLKQNVVITGGDGTIKNPFQLSVQ